MADSQHRSSPVCGRTPSDVYLNTLAEHMPQMTRLFQILDTGVTPNFLDVIAAISEMVAFHTDSDTFDSADKILREKMSGNKCRFCS